MTTTNINVNKKLKLHFFLLLAACYVGTFLSAPELGGMGFTQWLISGFVIGFIASLPLLFFIPTVLKPTPRSVSWLGFFLLAYLVWAILKMFSANGIWGGLLITTFNVSTFFYVVIWLRPFKKIAKQKKAEE